MNVGDIMSSPVYTIEPEENVAHARRLMLKHKISTLVVVSDEKMVGIVTKTDLSRRLAQAEPMWRRRPIDKIPVNMVMNDAPISIYPEASITQASNLMLENRINSLAVVKDNVVGIITGTDIMRYISQQDIGTKVSEVVGNDLVFVHRHHTINHVVQEMEKNEVNRVIVTGDSDEAVGMITTSNVALNIMVDNEGKMPSKSIKMARRSTPAGQKTYRYVKEVPLVAEDIMSELPSSIDIDETVVQAAKVMIEEHVIGLPVIHEDEIVGMVSRRDVLKATQ
ncbi:CBS domain-containing protein [Methanolobus halotolerans]|uniref:CBS domain-containing protein n=1 Tax=Methanolobus halotolerans TaxID=2052935 RepID=A0A4E0QX76_9EURY|nr:CBS domain-containing protein [Methanolobus halotolerans]TGC07233.1 CBS domain-containing protein [Methanolobus halotolerans]